jgi:hypothetical protein
MLWAKDKAKECPCSARNLLADAHRQERKTSQSICREAAKCKHRRPTSEVNKTCSSAWVLTAQWCYTYRVATKSMLTLGQH